MRLIFHVSIVIRTQYDPYTLRRVFFFFLSFFFIRSLLSRLFFFSWKLVYRQFLDPSATSTITSLFSNFPKFYARLQFNNANVYTPDLSRFHLYLNLSFFSGFFEFFFSFARFLSLILSFSLSLFHFYSNGIHKTFSFRRMSTDSCEEKTKPSIGINKQTEIKYYWEGKRIEN